MWCVAAMMLTPRPNTGPNPIICRYFCGDGRPGIHPSVERGSRFCFNIRFDGSEIAALAFTYWAHARRCSGKT